MSSPGESWDTSPKVADHFLGVFVVGERLLVCSGEGIQWESLPHSSAGGQFHHNCRDTRGLAWDTRKSA